MGPSKALSLSFCIVFLKAPQIKQPSGPTKPGSASKRRSPLLLPLMSSCPRFSHFSHSPPLLSPSPPGSQPFRCLYCAATFRFPGALQHHVTTEHFKQSETTFPCELCGELFTSQAQLDSHLESEHPKVMSTETQAAASQMVQVILGPSATQNANTGFLRLL